ncbi:MAG: hypothetical protein IPP14_13290 [Planctomycetes bacterium]|nr:hypothetical protein [Planctomycetota bacterium]
MSTLLINGFGRVGRALFRLLLRNGTRVVRINDPLPPSQLAYLLKYDSVMGRLDAEVSVQGATLKVGTSALNSATPKPSVPPRWRAANLLSTAAGATASAPACNTFWPWARGGLSSASPWPAANATAPSCAASTMPTCGRRTASSAPVPAPPTVLRRLCANCTSNGP